MRAAVYARVSTIRQAQAQGIEQQLDRLRAAVAERGWELDDQHVYRDDGYSGARLGRPGLDRLRDHAALAELDHVHGKSSRLYNKGLLLLDFLLEAATTPNDLSALNEYKQMFATRLAVTNANIEQSMSSS